MNYDDKAHRGCVTSRHMRREEIKNREKIGVEQKGPGLKVLWEHSEAGQELGQREEIKDQGQEWRRAASLSGNAETGFKLGRSR